jgi:MoaA/NifB/PqqE/SkfB family radical SAM enzyme
MLDHARDVDSDKTRMSKWLFKSRKHKPIKVDAWAEALWHTPIRQLSVNELRTWSEKRLRAEFKGDALHDNMLLNKWEFAIGRTRLESLPWRLSVPFITCNARCEFCAAWHIYGKADLRPLLESLKPVIRSCGELDLVGWGEPLIHPQSGAVVRLLREYGHPSARIALTTNGTLLKKWADRLVEVKIRQYAVSVHAASAVTHQDLMGFRRDMFDEVLAGVRALTAHKAAHPDISVEMVLVVTQQNIAEIPEFLSMSERLSADKVHLRTLMPGLNPPRAGLDYHRLAPYLHPDFERLRDEAIDAIARSSLSVRAQPEAWSRPLFMPEFERNIATLPLTPREKRTVNYQIFPVDWDRMGAGEELGETREEKLDNRLGRAAPLYCPSPYTALYINAPDHRMIPCVYMYDVPGHRDIHLKPSMTFDEAWNSPAMMSVRKRLHQGPLLPECLRCPFYC